ncbi:DUF1667 domain-containing protein [Candidatus Omnitrophota bacterium]
MNKKLICIECPKGCALSVDTENCKVTKVTGAECPKGEKYAVSEIENPQRILTTTLLTEGFSLKLLPVRTDQLIPKTRIKDALRAVRDFKVTKHVKAGDIVMADLLKLGVNLIATRDLIQ